MQNFRNETMTLYGVEIDITICMKREFHECSSLELLAEIDI